jgi:hypothetical protein
METYTFEYVNKNSVLCNPFFTGIVLPAYSNYYFLHPFFFSSSRLHPSLLL